MTAGSAARAAAATREPGSYAQILESSAWIGASSLLSVVIGMLRAKAMAVLLGPAGVGLLGIYSSIIDLTKNVAGMGVNSSGVRQIAAAAGSGDEQHIARTVAVLRAMAVLLGLSGAVLLAVAAVPVSRASFGNDGHVAAVMLLSLAVFLQVLGEGQSALLQGMRRIADLARATVFTAAFGTVLAIVLVYLFAERGVVPSLVAFAACSAGCAWWFSRRVKIAVPMLTLRLFAAEARPLLKLGFAFMASGLLMLGSLYAVRAMVVRAIGLDGAGLYQAAWALGGLYIGMILQAMGADFYPRLTAAISDQSRANRLVNEQTHVGLLLAGPGVLATLTLAPVVIGLLYSTRFLEAVELLRWFCVGMTIRVVSWPMGFVIVAQGKRRLFLGTEFLWAALNVSLAWLFIGWLGLDGIGLAFVLAYAVYALTLYPIVRRSIGFRWSIANRRAQLLFLALIGLVLLGFRVLPPFAAALLGMTATLGSGIYAAGILLRLVDRQALPRGLQRALDHLNFTGRRR